MRLSAMAFVVAGAAIAGGIVAFNGNQANAAGQCVDYIYNRGGVANCIINIQKIVNASGVTSQITADGAFGPLTEKAVKAFQTNRGIAADGVVGVQTWKKLCAVTQTAAKAPQKAAGCPVTVTPPVPTTGWTKVAWGSATNGALKAATDVYACKVPVTATTFQVRSKVVVTSSTGSPAILTGLTVRKQNTANTVAASFNEGNSVRFTGTPGAVYQMATNATSYGTPKYAIGTDVVWVQTEVISGNSAAGAASTYNSFGSALSRPLKVSQLINC